jgi:ketosteroid isomerase-like protein
LAFGSLLPHAAAEEMEDLTPSLEAAELSFAASVAAKDLESFAAHIDEQAIFAAGSVLNGKPAILQAWSGFFAEGAPKMEWHPETVVVQTGGKLGISKGPYTLTIKSTDGSESVQQGQFISIWERQDDGGWKIIFDSGCPPCPECASQ